MNRLEDAHHHTTQGVMERDRLVFTEVRKKRKKPIFMLTSGGYQVYTGHYTIRSDLESTIIILPCEFSPCSETMRG